MPKTTEEWMTALKKDWPSRMVLTCLTAFAAFAWTHGKETFTSEAQRMVIDTMKPTIDSMTASRNALGIRVDTLQATVDKQGRIQQEFFGAMMDAIPGLKQAVEARGQTNRRVVEKKAETDTLLTNLTKQK